MSKQPFPAHWFEIYEEVETEHGVVARSMGMKRSRREAEKEIERLEEIGACGKKSDMKTYRIFKL